MQVLLNEVKSLLNKMSTAELIDEYKLLVQPL